MSQCVCLKNIIEEFLWRWQRNPKRTFLHKTKRSALGGLAPIVQELKQKGIAEAPFEEIFGSHELFDELDRALRITEDSKGRDQLARSGMSAFRRYLHPDCYEVDDVFMRIALHPSVLNIVNHYLGLRSTIRSLGAWLDEPVEDEAKDTQLWHQDADDWKNIKMFIYMNDVTLRSGPFSFIPGSQRGGRSINVEKLADFRSTDVQMRKVIPEKEWKLCTGKAGSVIFADTTAYHKGTPLIEGERKMLMIQYVSGNPWYVGNLKVVGSREKLLDEQKMALKTWA